MTTETIKIQGEDPIREAVGPVRMSDAEYNAHLSRYHRSRETGEPVTSRDYRVDDAQRRDEQAKWRTSS